MLNPKLRDTAGKSFQNPKRPFQKNITQIREFFGLPNHIVALETD